MLSFQQKSSVNEFATLYKYIFLTTVKLLLQWWHVTLVSMQRTSNILALIILHRFLRD